MIKNISNLGDAALYCDFGKEVNKETNSLVIKYFKSLQKKDIRGITNLTPSYNKLIISFDLDLINSTCESVNIPIIASGGFGKISHINDLCTKTKCDAISVAHAIHYNKVTIKSIIEELLKLGQDTIKF